MYVIIYFFWRTLNDKLLL